MNEVFNIRLKNKNNIKIMKILLDIYINEGFFNEGELLYTDLEKIYNLLKENETKEKK